MRKLYFLFFILFSFFCKAQNAGDIAQTFGPAQCFNSTVNSIRIQPDGKTLVGGSFTRYNGIAVNRIVRLNADATNDATFTTGTGFNEYVKSIAVQPDGKILVGGYFTSFNGIPENKIIRLNSDGTKDTTFITGIGFDNTVNSIAIQTDGKILIGGDFTSYNGIVENKIVRLNTDGSKDTTFSTGTGFNSAVNSIVIQTNGKILIGGFFTSYKNVTTNRIIRLISDGNTDTSFTIGTGFNSFVYSIAVQSDGKILIGGAFSSYKGVTANRIIRLNSFGSADTSFSSGTGFNNYVYSIAIQADGKLLIGGSFSSYNGVTENRLIRLNSDGTKDTSYNIGVGFNGEIYSITINVDGKSLIGGYDIVNYDLITYYFICLNSDGTKNTSFNTHNGSGFSSQVQSIVIQPDGKILIGGDFTTYNNQSEKRIIRLNIDGTKDTSFNTGLGFNGEVESIAIQSDGKILVGGNFTTYKGVTENRIIRLNSDGTKDTSFNIGTGFNYHVTSIAVQTDGKIVVGGWFYTYNEITVSGIIRLNTNGSKDTSFNTGTGFSSIVNSVVLQPDGKIIVGGSFSTYNGVVVNSIIRLNNDGIIDNSFNMGVGFTSPGGWSPVKSMALQTDGKILVVGGFYSYNGVGKNGIIRLNLDGTIDTSFDSGTGSYWNYLSAVTIQSNGKILVGGSVFSYNGLEENSFIRLHSDGTKDTSFNIGTGFNGGLVSSIAMLNNDIILVGGIFDSYKTSYDSAYLIGLYSETSLHSDYFTNNTLFSLYPNPVSDILNIDKKADVEISSIQIYNIMGQLMMVVPKAKNVSTLDVSNLSSGNYFVKINSDKGTSNVKFIKR